MKENQQPKQKRPEVFVPVSEEQRRRNEQVDCLMSEFKLRAEKRSSKSSLGRDRYFAMKDLKRSKTSL